MACKKLTACYTQSCLNQKPGISNIYLLNFEDLDSVTLDTNGLVSAITYDSSLVTDDNFLTYEIQREVANLDLSNEINIQNSVSVSRPKLSFKLPGLDQPNLDLYAVLAESSVVAVFENVSGEFMMCGIRNGLNSTVLQILNEASSTGFKGISIQLEGLNEELLLLEDTFKDTFKSTHLKICV